MPHHFVSVFPIGSQCLTATLLDNAGMRGGSGPFDWIFCSLEVVNDCLKDDFDAFLNPKYYQPVVGSHEDPAHRLCDHEFFHRERGIVSMFVHANPTIPDRYDYLIRCVERFRAALIDQRPSGLLAICAPDRGSEEDFVTLCDHLESASTTTAVVIFVTPPGDVRTWTSKRRIGRHELYVFQPVSPIDGIRFADQADNAFMIAKIKEMIVIDSDAVAASHPATVA